MTKVALHDYPSLFQIKLSTDNDILAGLEGFKSHVNIYGHCGGKTKNFYCISVDGVDINHRRVQREFYNKRIRDKVIESQDGFILDHSAQKVLPIGGNHNQVALLRKDHFQLGKKKVFYQHKRHEPTCFLEVNGQSIVLFNDYTIIRDGQVVYQPTTQQYFCNGHFYPKLKTIKNLGFLLRKQDCAIIFDRNFYPVREVSFAPHSVQSFIMLKDQDEIL